jgi:hypothetical protein
MTGTESERTEGSWTGCNIDFGGGQSLELDYRQAEAPWISVGPGVTAADIWVKGLVELPDVRVRIERTDDGLQIRIDRGDQSNVWWPADGSPRLTVTFDQRAREATATAAVGQNYEFQEVNLGTVPF